MCPFHYVTRITLALLLVRPRNIARVALFQGGGEEDQEISHTRVTKRGLTGVVRKIQKIEFLHYTTRVTLAQLLVRPRNIAQCFRVEERGGQDIFPTRVTKCGLTGVLRKIQESAF